MAKYENPSLNFSTVLTLDDSVSDPYHFDPLPGKSNKFQFLSS